jgi:hypothetical protein
MISSLWIIGFGMVLGHGYAGYIFIIPVLQIIIFVTPYVIIIKHMIEYLSHENNKNPLTYCWPIMTIITLCVIMHNATLFCIFSMYISIFLSIIMVYLLTRVITKKYLTSVYIVTTYIVLNNSIGTTVHFVLVSIFCTFLIPCVTTYFKYDNKGLSINVILIVFGVSIIIYDIYYVQYLNDLLRTLHKYIYLILKNS